MIDEFPKTIKARDSVTNDVVSVLTHHGLLIGVNYEDAIGLGAISGHTHFRGFGRRQGLTTAASGDDLWEGVSVISVYPDQTTGEQVTFVSTSANDTAAGTNVQQLDMHYLDNTGAEQHETITMNGLVPVNSVATNVRFIQYIHTSAIGVFGNTAAGDITVYSTATPANIFNIIKAGGNMSLNASRMIPAGKSFYLKYIATSSTSGKAMSIRFRATCDQDGTLTPGIFIFNEIFELQDDSLSLNIAVPRRFSAFTIIKATAFSQQAGGSAALSYGGFIE
jgi:hypothetical protein